MRCQGGFVIAGLMAALFVFPAPAEACGGFFCSGPSACTGLFCTTAPTQQSGENLLFSIEDDGTLSVHIQILYQGESDRFAWILPLPSVPSAIGVGTDDLFTQLGFQTAPRFAYDGRTEGTCAADPTCERPDASGFSDAAVSADGAASGPTIHLREEVGPYDAVVLESDSTEALLTWLRDNGFDIPSAAEPLVAEYVAARHVFVAVRLLSDRSAGEIQPLVLRYAEGQPCVPLRMTAIAATPDMPITAYFLADARVVPTNYSLIEPTFDTLRLWTGDLDYATYISNEVDDAGGHAFVTDYAGPVPAISITRADVADLATEVDPMAFLRALFNRGYGNDAQLLGILPRFLPPPEGQTPQQYYQCLSQFFGTAESCGYTGGFDPAMLAAALDAQIIRPRAEAQAMLARHPTLTRLFTTMSPADMSLDPLFRVDAGLPADVSNVHTATQVTECGPTYFASTAPVRVDLPSGRSEPFREGTPSMDPAAWCEARGLLPPVGSRRDAGSGDPGGGGGSTAGGGGLCAIGAGHEDAGGAMFVLATTLIALARRRSRGTNR